MPCPFKLHTCYRDGRVYSLQRGSYGERLSRIICDRVRENRPLHYNKVVDFPRIFQILRYWYHVPGISLYTAMMSDSQYPIPFPSYVSLSTSTREMNFSRNGGLFSKKLSFTMFSVYYICPRDESLIPVKRHI